MILNRVIGSCPTCGTQNSFGNVLVSKNILTRGCTACGKISRLFLPRITKSMLYLDQFFFSHAFRNSSSDYSAAISLISQLAHQQLIVVPFSPTHKTETNRHGLGSATTSSNRVWCRRRSRPPGYRAARYPRHERRY